MSKDRNEYPRQNAGAIIVAAGAGERMGGMDKIFALLDGEPLLARVVDAFTECKVIGQIVIVIRRQQMIDVRRMITRQGWTNNIDVCVGGQRRQDSVQAGLEQLTDCEWAIIHDGARPLVTTDLIERGLKAATETGAAVSAVPFTDTIKVAREDRMVLHTPSRENLWAVQTPQVFRYSLISEAYRQAEDDVTDDASLVEKLGYQVKLYMGLYDNIKVTTPEDLAIAEALWQRRQD